MTTEQKAVLQGLLKLSPEQRREVLKEALEFDSKNRIEKGLFSETLKNDTRMILGPTSSTSCPCCGR